ncbi:hypothetical protein [Nocardioides speluncae]|uniref:hypothetical protein n=1 Tax=Nocardioides speluncae TaxID=2670337 RepID=UPI000D69A40B|nr:hypothetical protein [Nocardioides speluncae]
MREEKVEQMVRESLERHAHEADVDVPVADRARAAAGRTPSAGRLLLVAAAVAAIAVGGVAIAQTGGGDGGGPAQPTKSNAPVAVDVPADWRTEAWRGVEVKVPPTWGWGGAPVEDGTLLDCGIGSARAASDLGRPSAAYVGRPVYLTDACTTIDAANRPAPAAPYVWLGAPLEPGTVKLSGYTEETVEVGGTTVTVATDDAELRAQILGSARPIPADAACAPELDAPPTASGVGDEGLGPPLGMTVCTYREDDGRLRLATTAEFDAEATERLLRAVHRAPHARCTAPRDSGEVAVIEARGEDKFGAAGSVNTQRLVVHLGGECPQVNQGEGWPDKKLTRAIVQEWTVGAVPVTLHGPADETGEFAGLFIGILG